MASKKYNKTDILRNTSQTPPTSNLIIFGTFFWSVIQLGQGLNLSPNPRSLSRQDSENNHIYIYIHKQSIQRQVIVLHLCNRLKQGDRIWLADAREHLLGWLWEKPRFVTRNTCPHSFNELLTYCPPGNEAAPKEKYKKERARGAWPEIICDDRTKWFRPAFFSFPGHLKLIEYVHPCCFVIPLPFHTHRHPNIVPVRNTIHLSVTATFSGLVYLKTIWNHNRTSHPHVVLPQETQCFLFCL